MPYTKPLRTITSADGQIWFVAKDICEALDIANHRDAIAGFPENEKGVAATDTPGGLQNANIVNEAGMYRLIFQSRKPEAEMFKTWVLGEVLPSIRRTGKYSSAKGKILNARSPAGELVEMINKRLSHGERVEIAAALGMSINTICDNLTGRVRRPKLWRLQKMVDWLDARDNQTNTPLI